LVCFIVCTRLIQFVRRLGVLISGHLLTAVRMPE